MRGLLGKSPLSSLLQLPTRRDGGFGQLPYKLWSAPSAYASFRARKGSDQAIATTSETQVTFATEDFDNGGYYASHVWTPPQGMVVLALGLNATAIAGASTWAVTLRKNGSPLLAVPLFDLVGANGWYVDVASGADAYDVSSTCSDSAYNIVTGSWFAGVRL